ncbi:hypothetical protein Maes01_00776 [Microbulbifer aestuariivivens]|uniref:ABM domain-containing protein n=1 Tax=Microbulbifer aestuariivivens TaxID=1908308 RepID=A0ABP9WM00_9GAMM
MSKVTLRGYILVPESELEVVKNELDNHKRPTLEEPGCLVFRVTENPENPLRFDVYEEFAHRAAFDLHQQRVRASRWGQVTLNIERHYQIHV